MSEANQNRKPTSVDHGKLEKLDYIIVPGNPGFGFKEQSRYNTIYSYWKSFWKPFYENAKSSETLKADDFTRSAAVAALMSGNEVVGIQLYSFFDLGLRGLQEHSYLQHYSDIDMARIRKNAKTLVSMEFLTISADWRKSQIGLPLSDILTGCGVRIQQSVDADATITISRQDKKVTELLARHGFKALTENLSRHNHTVDILQCLKSDIVSHPDADVRKYMDLYWSRRQDFTGLTRNVSVPAKKAA